MSWQRDRIKLDAALLGLNESSRIYCPWCEHRDMGVTRTSDGVLYNCHRATCGQKGFVGASAASLYKGTNKPANKAKPYEGALVDLERCDLDYFSDKYELHCNAVIHRIFRNQNDEYVLPVSWLDYDRGYVVRQPWDGSPRKGRDGQPKTKVWMHSEKPVQAAYRHRASSPGKTVVILEDQLSAIKASESSTDVTGVALCGTDLNVERVREIAMLKPARVILALDKDATSTAFDHARKFGMAFDKMRVAILEKDIKDTPMSEIAGVLGL